ncbi:MAG: hypothetical protein R3C04_09025 [Hyphomonas sp.]
MSEHPSAIASEKIAEDMPFSGSPQKYLRLCVIGSLAIHAYLFLGYWAIRNFLADDPWPKGWLVPVLTVVSAVWFAWYSYRWIMRLDAQYGRGSGWILEPVTVKLPWEKSRKK